MASYHAGLALTLFGATCHICLTDSDSLHVYQPVIGKANRSGCDVSVTA